MLPKVNISHRIIAVLIAAWIPFCCCTLRSAAGIVSTDGPAPASCCCQETTQDCDTGETPSHDDGCMACCIKVPPDPPQDWAPPIDLLGLPIFEVVSVDYFNTASPLALVRARPPDPPPSARPLLKLGCLLLV